MAQYATVVVVDRRCLLFAFVWDCLVLGLVLLSLVRFANTRFWLVGLLAPDNRADHEPSRTKQRRQGNSKHGGRRMQKGKRQAEKQGEISK